MEVTITDNQRVILKEKVRNFYLSVQPGKYPGNCAVKDVLAPSLDKWSLLCLYNLAFNEVLRFGQLKKYVPNISSRMLTVTLRKLEDARLVSRKIYPEVPPKVEYRLTDFGYGFTDRLVDLNTWVYEEWNASK